MEELLRFREQHGSQHVVVLPDGQLIPCRLLTIDEFIEYDRLIRSRRYGPLQLEDEIFKKCVLDKVRVNNIQRLRAGVVSQVAKAILDHSSPQDINDLDAFLNVKRAETSSFLHEAISIICQAFPGYTPDDLFKMDFDTLWSRLALAERKLLQTGFLDKPLSFNPVNQERPQQRQKRQPPKPPPEKLADMWKEQKAPQSRKPTRPKKVKQTIITDSDVIEHRAAYTGHESEDRIILEHNMVNETAGVYKDYVDQIQKGQTVRIKTVEERQKAAIEAMKRSAAIRKQMAGEKIKQEEQLELALTQKRAQAKAKRRHKK